MSKNKKQPYIKMRSRCVISPKGIAGRLRNIFLIIFTNRKKCDILKLQRKLNIHLTIRILYGISVHFITDKNVCSLLVCLSCYAVIVFKSLRCGLELRFLCVAYAAHFFILELTVMIISFCGHSDYIKAHNDEEKILSFLYHNIKEEEVEFYLGGYGSFDNFAYTCAKKYKSTNPLCKLIYVTPYMNPKQQTHTYDLIIYPPLESIPPRFAITHRKKWMIGQSDIVIAYLNRQFGGAYKSYLIAKKLKKTIFNLAEE